MPPWLMYGISILFHQADFQLIQPCGCLQGHMSALRPPVSHKQHLCCLQMHPHLSYLCSFGFLFCYGDVFNHPPCSACSVSTWPSSSGAGAPESTVCWQRWLNPDLPGASIPGADADSSMQTYLASAGAVSPTHGQQAHIINIT